MNSIFQNTFNNSSKKSQKEGGLLNGAMNFFLKISSNKNISWYVSAKLDQPMAFDISKKNKNNSKTTINSLNTTKKIV
jgi:hypothetical protein